MDRNELHAKRIPRIAPVLFLITISLPLPFAFDFARAQEPDDVIRVRTDLVAIPFVVTDSRGCRVSGLKADNFVVAGEEANIKIDYFSSGAERVALLFALDTSGSAREILTQQRSASLALFSRFGRGSRVAVLHFADIVRLTVPFTTDADAAQEAFNFEARPNTATAIFDGAAAGVRSFDGRGGFSMERRIVILMSDGVDTLSSTKYQAVIDAARQRGVSFYVIHFPLFTPRDGRLAPRPPTKGFRELAEQTGGRYFRIGSARNALDPHAKIDLLPVFQAIEDDLRSQYVIGFYPGGAGRDNRFHRVTIGLASGNRRTLHVRQFAEGYDIKP